MNPNSKRFFGELESLRGIAALLVVFFHIEWANPLTLHRFFRNGYLMVDLFFVLSGFVICYNYGQKISCIRDIVRFMFLRLGRLYPLHLFFLLIFVGIEFAKYFGESRFGLMPSQTHAFALNNLPAFMANLLLIQPFIVSTNSSFNSPSWSIGVEFYTYLIFAFIVLIFPGKRKFTIASFIVVSLAIVLYSFWGAEGLSPRTGLGFLSCILCFFSGTLAYHAYSRYGRYFAPCCELIVGCITIGLIIFLSLNENSEFNFLVLPLFFLLIIALAASPPKGGLISKFLNSGPLRWMGAISYSIYMTHLLILMVVGRSLAFTQKHCNPEFANWLSLIFVLLAIAIVLAVSQLTYQWIEKPWQNKFREFGARRFKFWAGRS